MKYLVVGSGGPGFASPEEAPRLNVTPVMSRFFPQVMTLGSLEMNLRL